MSQDSPLGATWQEDDGCRFLVWAPSAQQVEVHLTSPQDLTIALQPIDKGYHIGQLQGVAPGTLYYFRLDGEKERPDPASRNQPQGVHGPSQVVDPRFSWQDQGWRGLPLQRYVIYELHVGAFTPSGTFDAIIAHLPDLNELGVSAIELMPVAQFPGERNWGYDGVDLYAAQSSYGGVDGLRRLVNACHQQGLAVILDVVYNHLGPEGNYLADFGPYFTQRYQTPWGPAINFDGPGSDEVRRFFIENALYWLVDCHVDALRLDAVHAILDHSPRTFLEEMAGTIHQKAAQLNRRMYLIAESSANDARLVRSPAKGGYGLDGQWNDDFHHSFHTLLTGEDEGYYQDYGQLDQLVKALTEGFVYSGEYSPYRQRRHGTSSREIPAHRLVVFVQNHDQVGNRMLGERLGQLVPFEALKLSAGLVLLSPYTPLLFMGEEYAVPAPFQYFVSHTDPDLVEAVRQGRKREFAAFGWQGEPPDPQAETTFQAARLHHELRHEGRHRTLWELYRELLLLRKSVPALARLSKQGTQIEIFEDCRTLVMTRTAAGQRTVSAFNLGLRKAQVELALQPGKWRKLADSADQRWDGPGSLVAPDLDCDGGKVELHLPSQSFVLLVHQKGMFQ